MSSSGGLHIDVYIYTMIDIYGHIYIYIYTSADMYLAMHIHQDHYCKNLKLHHWSLSTIYHSYTPEN